MPGDSLSAIGVGRHLRDDLRSDIAGRGEGVRLLYQRVRDDGSVLKHILQIDQLAVGYGAGDVAHVVDVDDRRIELARHS